MKMICHLRILFPSSNSREGSHHQSQLKTIPADGFRIKEGSYMFYKYESLGNVSISEHDISPGFKEKIISIYPIQYTIIENIEYTDSKGDHED